MLVVTLLLGHRGLLSQRIMGAVLVFLYFLAFAFLLMIIKKNYLSYACIKSSKSTQKNVDDGDDLLEHVNAIIKERENSHSRSPDRIPAASIQMKNPMPNSDQEHGDMQSKVPQDHQADAQQHRPQQPERQEQKADGFETFLVRVPAHSKPGDVVTFTVEGGRQAKVRLPAHARAGHRMSVRLPAASARSRHHDRDRDSQGHRHPKSRASGTSVKSGATSARKNRGPRWEPERPRGDVSMI
jgi:hypothetical protein